MTSLLLRSALHVSLILLAVAGVFAQSGSDVQRSGKMFDGETLVFEGKVNKVLHGISIAEITFSASVPSGDKLLVSTDAVSKGTLLKLFRYSFAQHYESTIALDGFRIEKTTKHDVQKERIRDSVADFDYPQNRVTFVETDPKDPNRPPRRIASELKTANVQDIVSAIYWLRTMPLAVGLTMSITVSDSGLVYSVPMSVTARERQESATGKVWCYRVEPDIFGPGKLIEQGGKMTIWLTEDPKHLPVHAQIDSQYGKIDIKLKSVNGKK